MTKQHISISKIIADLKNVTLYIPKNRETFRIESKDAHTLYAYFALNEIKYYSNHDPNDNNFIRFYLDE